MASINLTKEELMTLIIALPESKPDLRRKLQWKYDAVLRDEGKQRYIDQIETEAVLGEKNVAEAASEECPFLVSWRGVCKKPVYYRGRCKDHWAKRKCWMWGCEKLTVQDCSATLTLGVCGVAYCEDHKHETQH